MLQSLIGDYHLAERYNNGFLKLTPDGMKAAKSKFIKTVRNEERVKTARKWNDYVTLVNGIWALIGSALTLLVQWLMKAIL